ncbi:MAG: Ubiquinone biosynthesis O-methyltransferase [Candidatus Woesearchaeota archaeon]|nr:Ubiquinone biosynthesis O-methyltransferase [Candidatus Woesearchaeota archaeon]
MGTYLDTCQSDFWRAVFQHELDYIVNALSNHNDILSVGCGPAIIEGEMQELGYNLTGLDVTAEALQGAPDSIRTEIGTAEKMGFPDKSFDAVIYVTSLQFIDNPEKAIQETKRVLRPNGDILIMLLNTNSQYFEEQTSNPESHMSSIKHTNLGEMERMVSKYIEVKAEYFLGIMGEEIFENSDPGTAALYILRGTLDNQKI